MQFRYVHSSLTNHTLCALKICPFVLFGLLACAPPTFSDELIPFVVQNSLYRTNLGLSNLDPLPADVSILVYDDSGRLAGQGLVQVPGLGFINLTEIVYFIFGHPSDLPFEGYVRLQSTQRIVAFASQIQ